MYALVLLKPRPATRATARLDDEHEAFITDLTRSNRILLGGEWTSHQGSVAAAYLLRVASLDEAAAVAEDDPLVRARAYEADIVQWDLVGINPEAIEADLVLRPGAA